MSVSMEVGLAPSLAAFARQWPEVILTVKTTTDRANLKAMEADVAIRALPVGTPPDPSLVGRKTAVLNEAASGSEGVESGLEVYSPLRIYLANKRQYHSRPR